LLASLSSIIDNDSLSERALQEFGGVILFGLMEQHFVEEDE
jgi:hypothetical protein